MTEGENAKKLKINIKKKHLVDFLFILGNLYAIKI
jgi:hypothetical protein